MEERDLDREPTGTLGDEVDDVLHEFGGDARAAIRALLHDVRVLAADFDSSVSRGFVRRATGRGRRSDGR